MKIEIKITPVDNGGFILKTYDKDGDQRVPLQTLVAEDVAKLTEMIQGFYSNKSLINKQ